MTFSTTQKPRTATFPWGEGRKRTSNFLFLTLSPPPRARGRRGGAGGGGGFLPIFCT